MAAVTPEEAKPDSDSPPLRYDTRVKAAGIFFPPTDFLDWNGKLADLNLLGSLLFLGGTNGHSEAEIRERALQISPARLVKPPTIPFLFIHGDADPLVPLQQSQKMVEALKAAGEGCLTKMAFTADFVPTEMITIRVLRYVFFKRMEGPMSCCECCV